MPSLAVVASSGLLFVPAFRAFFTQHFLVAIILFGSALFSTLYHAFDESRFAELDSLFACLAIIVTLVLVIALILCRPVSNWRIAIPITCGVIALVLYFATGSTYSAPHDSDHYEIYHSIWHILVSVTALCLVWYPVQLHMVTGHVTMAGIGSSMAARLKTSRAHTLE